MRRTMVMKRSGVLTNLRKRCAAVVALAALLQGTALANPTGPQVVSGQASFANIGNTLAVTNSPSAIINWNSFSIGQGQITNFIQQSSASAVLNRVIGGNVSAIYGTLQSNGKVFLINQNGILFGPGAQVNVNGLMASTLDIKNADFLAGRFRFFAGATAAGIENQGRITTPSGGSIYLIAPDIKNSGIITASNGDIVLAAGHTVSLVDSGSPDIAAVVNAPADQALNLGQIIAQAGRIGIYGGIIAQKGIVSANSAVKDQSGRIFFKATKDITLDKGSVTSAQGGTIKVVGGMEDGTVAVSGTLDASAPTGGNGGSIETSAARVKVDDSARITTAAPYGKAGTWLLDPVDVTIQSGGSTTVPAGGGTVSPSTQPSTVDVATLQTALNNGSNVVIDTQGGSGGNGDITVASAIGVSPTSTGATLTLNAFRNITINQPVTASGAYGLNLNLNANTGGGGGASFTNQAISLNGGTLSLSGGNLNLSTGALIANAVVTGTSGLWLNANNSATLDGVTLGAPMTADVGSTLNISNGLTLNNTLTMVEGDYYNNTYVNFNGTGTQTLGGTGTIVSSAGTWGTAGNIQPTGSASLTIGSGITIKSSGKDLQVGDPGLGLTNNGTLQADGSTLMVTGSNWTNNGTLRSNGGTLTTAGTWTNNGTITSSSGTLNASGTWINNGLLTSTGGTLNISSLGTNSGTIQTDTGTITTNNANLTNASTGLITGSGTLTLGTGTLINNGTLNPGGTGAAGTLSITGNLTMGSTGVVNLEMGGTTAGAYDVLAVSGTANLGGNGTLTVSTLGAYSPSVSDSFNGITAASFTGDFGTKNFTGFSASPSGGAYRVTYTACLGTICFDNSDGNWLWSDANNWDTNVLPSSGDNVYIGLAGSNTVSYSSGTYTVSGLHTTSNNTLSLLGGGLTVTGPSAVAGTLNIAGGTATLNGGTTVGTLNLSGGTLQGSGAATVDSMTWNSGTVTGTGTLTVNNTLNVTTVGSPTNLTSRTLTNNGTATFTKQSGGNWLDLYNGATYNNAAGATTTFTNDIGIYAYGSASTVNNAGVMTRSGGTGTAGIQPIFNNTGTLYVNTGTFYLGSGGTDTGTFNVSSGATLQFSGGTHALNTGSNLMGAGSVLVSGGAANISDAYNLTGGFTVSGGTATFGGAGGTTIPALTVSGGTATLNGDASISNLTLASGTLNGTGNITADAMTWNAGTVTGTGTLTVNNTLNVTTVGSPTNLTSRTLTNNGVATFTRQSGGNWLDLYNGATYNNAAGATTTFTNDIGIYAYGSASTVNNAGVMTRSAGIGTVGIQPIFNNTGTLNVNTGTFYLGSGGTDTGTFNVSSGATLQFSGGTHSLNAGSAVANSGSVVMSGGTVSLNTGSAIANSGSLLMSGGTLTLGTGSDVTGPGSVTFAGGTGNVNGGYSIAATGTTSVTGGSVNFNVPVTFANTFTYNAGGSVSIGGSGNLVFNGLNWIGGPDFAGSGTMTTNGTTTVSSSGAGVGKNWVNNGTLNITGAGDIEFFNTANLTLTNAAGGIINLLGSDSTPIRTYNNSGHSLNNLGTINKQGGSAATQSIGDGSLAINNNGIINVNSGTLNISGGGTNSGAYNVASGTTLNLTSGGTYTGSFSVAGGATLEFTGGTNNLNAGSNVTGAGSVNFVGGTSNVNDGFDIAATGTVSDTGGMVNFNVPVTFANTFTYNAGGSVSIGGSGNLVFNGLNWIGGPDFTGSGTMTTNGTTTVSSSGAGVGKNWINNGTLNITGAGDIEFFNTANLTLTNAAGGTINLLGSDSAPIRTHDNSGHALNNLGTINKQGGSAAAQSIGDGSLAINNNGIINVNGGTLNISGGGTDTGTFNVSSGATLQFSGGTHTLNTGSDVTGAGSVTFAGGTSDINGGYSIAATGTTSVTGGSVNFNVPVSFANPFTYNAPDGTLISGSGNLVFNGLTWTGTSDAPEIVGTGTMVTNGTTTLDLALAGLGRNWTNNGTLNITSTGSIGFWNTSNVVLTNAASGVINLTGSNASPIYTVNNSGHSVINYGIINKQAGSAATQTIGDANAAINNAAGGVINVNSGTLTVGGALSQSGAIETVSGATFQKTGSWTNSGTIRGAGTIDIGGSSYTLTNNGTISPGASAGNTIGTLSIAGNLLNSASGIANMKLGGTSAGQYDVLAVSGVATLGGTLNVSEANGYLSQLNDSFTVLTAGTRSGSFATLNPPAGVGMTASPTGNLLLTVNSITATAWNSGTSGYWDVASNWTHGVPTADAVVTLTYAGNPTIMIQNGDTTYAKSIAGGGYLDISGGSLSVFNGATLASYIQSSGTFTGSGGTLSVSQRVNQTGGTISGFNTLSLTDTSGSAMSLATINAGSIAALSNNGITLAGGGQLTTTGTGDALVLAAGAGAFINNSTAAALNATNGGRWLIWSGNPANDSRGGILYNFKQYNATYGSTTVQGSGNGFLYSVAPVVTVGLTGTTSKTYDGTTAAALTAGNYTISGALDGDTINLNTPALGTYDTKNAGTGKTVTVTDLSATMANSGATVYGYTLSSTTASGAIGTITPKALNLNATASDKTYDGTTAAAVTGYGVSGFVGSETVTANSASASFADRNAGTGKTVTVSGITLSDGTNGGLASNYTVAGSTTTTANITPARLTITAATNAKTYDGATTAGVTPTVSGLLGGDTVTGLAEAYMNKTAGTGKTLLVTGYTINDGNSGNNYTVTTVNDTTGVINPRALTVSATASNKVYDGTTAATLGTLSDNRIAGDLLTIGSSGASFSDKNAGAGKMVTVTGISLSGNDAGNYTYSTTATTTADITPRALTVSGITAGSKVYDGTTAATINTTGASYSGLIAGDAVSVSATGAFDTKNVGTGKPVTLVSTYSGSDAGNYIVTGQSATTADITPKAISVSGITASNKVYDGTPTATVNTGSAVFNGMVTGDSLTVAATGAFSDKNAGSGKSVTLMSSYGGNDLGNYTITAQSTATADITVRPLSTWTAGRGGLWSNQANWDAIPDGQNVLAVSIPGGGSYQVTYDGGSTTLQNLNSAQTLVMASGNLAIGTTLSTTGFQQSGGSLTGAGSLKVTNSFNQTGGSIHLAGAATLTQATGDLTIANLTAATVSLTSQTGRISQNGPIVTSELTTHSATGTELNGANQVASFRGVNDSSGDILLTNTAAPFIIAAISEGGTGSVVINNVGATITGSEPITSGGSVSLAAHSPLTIGSGGIKAAGDILLVASASGNGNDNLTLNGAVASTSGGITLKAGDHVVMGAAGTATAQAGTVSTTDRSGTTTVTAASLTSQSVQQAVNTIVVPTQTQATTSQPVVAALAPATQEQSAPVAPSDTQNTPITDPSKSLSVDNPSPQAVDMLSSPTASSTQGQSGAQQGQQPQGQAKQDDKRGNDPTQKSIAEKRDEVRKNRLYCN